MNSGLLGCVGNWGRGGAALTGAAAGVLGAEVLGRNTISPIDMKEILNFRELTSDITLCSSYI